MLVEKEQLVIKSLQECMIVANHCMNECLAEEHVGRMLDCIYLDRECVEICSHLEQAIIRKSLYAKELAKICIAVCEDCAKECKKHDHKHCQYCAEICTQCVENCKKYLEV
ncbi:four-helix bundle copper-binding protein [Bacillus sp. B1-b2]|uniref:four-helix bundle copper-binding protein n=1 Tax=Bacillus sp. B1-b2 TaxID=2653201 RepID=UPI001261F91E|nr:four-helix bundle copper-binding protein [Bacillus sp. B1-b2]KAB7666523.1 four-helix bundle copper-binding protein [Bacillus sp. B1-b2]